MKTSAGKTYAERCWGLITKPIAVFAVLALVAPLTATAQQTVFYDTFESSTINGGPTTNMMPGGLPTASYTSYEIGSGKNSTASTNVPGHLWVISSATSSGNMEAQALFTKFPVTLSTNGDYVELDATFMGTSNMLQGLAGNAVGPYIGLFNSGGVPPLAGTLLWNGGLSTQTTAISGGTKNWVGYQAGMLNSSSSGSAWSIAGRPAQTVANNKCQILLYGASTVGGHSSAVPTGPYPFPNLTIGAQYTAQLRITLQDSATLVVSNALFTGTDTTGTIIWSNFVTYTGANFLTTNFDGLAVGSRPGENTSQTSSPITNDFTAIKVVAGLADQAGPYFFVTSSGDPCSGGLTIGVSGSVTTNDYLLYLDGVNTGQSVAGTGAAVDFGLQTIAGTYTIMASNTITGSVGPMLGSASVLAPGINIVTQPASVSIVSNLPTSFTVDAVGAALSYQWLKNGVPLTNNANVSGANTSTLSIAAAQLGDAATTVDGYTVVIQTPCGDITTSSPPAALTLTAPRNLIWAGANPDNSWDFIETNFTLSSSPTVFAQGDDVTFDDTSGNTTLAISNAVTPTLVTVSGTHAYTLKGPNKMTGISQLVDSSAGTLTILSDQNDYTGGTTVNSGATLQLGDGSSTAGSLIGVVNVMSGGTLQYYFNGPGNNTPVNIFNSLAGNGTVNYLDNAGSILATPSAMISSNFNGTINVQGYTCLHASDGNAGYNLGNGSTVNVPANAQVWLDRSATTYNNTFNIAGTGWLGATPNTGAIRLYGSTINGPINLLADARIGGTINGGTIQGIISGAYQLEIWGTTNSFVLTVGPTNGSPQGYASTLITAGAIRAANSNALSGGPLTLDVGGDLQVYGNNVTVSSLTSINSGNIQLFEGARVRNMNTSKAGTLTVGTDGSSSQFDGTFSDGAAASLGLTKVGAGTLTLTALSTNTGPVTVAGGTIAMSGSGSFSRASAIAIASGATYDVSAAGGTLTLNANQVLKHSGATTGPITVTGNVNLGSGTLQLAINHAGLAHDSLAASGTTTISGTLTVTNIGATLQAGDVFQLFPGATPGFTAFNLQTNDVANNVNYTWNNTIATDGKLTVATVVPIVNTNPPQVQVSVSGSTLSLAWPTNAGWTLLTNSVGLAATNQWFPYPGSTSMTNVDITIDPHQSNVFFRMAYPYP